VLHLEILEHLSVTRRSSLRVSSLRLGTITMYGHRVASRLKFHAGEQEGLGVAATGEPDAGSLTDGAVHAVGPDDVVGVSSSPPPRRAPPNRGQR
jgi:hypothetical protein